MIEKNGGKQKKFSGDYLKSDRENSKKKMRLTMLKVKVFLLLIFVFIQTLEAKSIGK